MPAGFASPPGLRIFHVVGQPTLPQDITDVAGHLAAAYGATGRTLVPIRPDGYVALISDAGDAAAVSDYLAAAFRALPSQTNRLPKRTAAPDTLKP
jgi:hypothetical protein